MMHVILLSPVPSQSFDIQLGGQNCTINLYQKTTGMFLDLFVDGKVIIQTRIVRDRVKLVRLDYLGFIGDLAMMDNQGTSDPSYDGLGSRFVLGYFAVGEG